MTASGRYGILPSGGSTITCERSRLASALLSAIQMPRRSAPALWGSARPLSAANRTTITKAHLMFLTSGAGKMNLVTLSLDTVIFDQFGSFGLSPQRNAQGPGPGIHGGVLHPRLIHDRIGPRHREPLHDAFVFVHEISRLIQPCSAVKAGHIHC